MGLVTEISLPSYSVASPPDCESVSSALDAVVCATFGVVGGRAVGLRCVSLLDHPSHTHDSLADVILTTGTDRYDSSRTGPLHTGIHIPFHGEENPPFSASRFRYPDKRAEAVLGLVKVLPSRPAPRPPARRP